MKKQLLSLICTSALILLFTYTALSKVLDNYRFVFQMRLSPLPLMKTAAPALGWIVPFVEAMIVITLAFEFSRKRSLYASLIVLSLFELYILGMLITGLKLPCSCGGVIAFMSWKQHLLFNAVFIAINIIAINKTIVRPVQKRVAVSAPK